MKYKNDIDKILKIINIYYQQQNTEEISLHLFIFYSH